MDSEVWQATVYGGHNRVGYNLVTKWQQQQIDTI